jgi:hypothetical protein
MEPKYFIIIVYKQDAPMELYHLHSISCEKPVNKYAFQAP